MFRGTRQYNLGKVERFKTHMRIYKIIDPYRKVLCVTPKGNYSMNMKFTFIEDLK